MTSTQIKKIYPRYSVVRWDRLYLSETYNALEKDNKQFTIEMMQGNKSFPLVLNFAEFNPKVNVMGRYTVQYDVLCNTTFLNDGRNVSARISDVQTIFYDDVDYVEP